MVKSKNISSVIENSMRSPADISILLNLMRIAQKIKITPKITQKTLSHQARISQRSTYTARTSRAFIKDVKQIEHFVYLSTYCVFDEFSEIRVHAGRLSHK